MSRNIEVAKQMFKKPALFYVFVLQYSEGEMRQRLLSITLQHYKNLSLAERWINNIRSELMGVESIIGSDAASDALNVAQRIYEGMVKHGK